MASRNGVRLTDAQKIKVEAMIEAGKQRKDVAAYLGVAPGSVNRILARNGIDYAWDNRYSDEDVARITAARALGMAYESIAVWFGTSATAIRTVFSRRGKQ